jgi:hypothetical protein
MGKTLKYFAIFFFVSTLPGCIVVSLGSSGRGIFAIGPGEFWNTFFVINYIAYYFFPPLLLLPVSAIVFCVWLEGKSRAAMSMLPPYVVQSNSETKSVDDQP